MRGAYGEMNTTMTESGNKAVELPSCGECGGDKFTTIRTTEREYLVGPEGHGVIRIDERYSIVRCAGCGTAVPVRFVDSLLALFGDKGVIT